MTKDISGLKSLISQEFNISQKLKEVNNSVSHKAQAKRAQRIAEEKAKYEAEGKAEANKILSASLTSCNVAIPVDIIMGFPIFPICLK